MRSSVYVNVISKILANIDLWHCDRNKIKFNYNVRLFAAWNYNGEPLHFRLVSNSILIWNWRQFLYNPWYYLANASLLTTTLLHNCGRLMRQPLWTTNAAIVVDDNGSPMRMCNMQADVVAGYENCLWLHMRHFSWNAAAIIDNRTGDDICDTLCGRQTRHPLLTTLPVTTYATASVDENGGTNCWQQGRWRHMRHHVWTTNAAPFKALNHPKRTPRSGLKSLKPFKALNNPKRTPRGGFKSFKTSKAFNTLLACSKRKLCSFFVGLWIVVNEGSRADCQYVNETNRPIGGGALILQAGHQPGKTGTSWHEWYESAFPLNCRWTTRTSTGASLGRWYEFATGAAGGYPSLPPGHRT